LLHVKFDNAKNIIPHAAFEARTTNW